MLVDIMTGRLACVPAGGLGFRWRGDWLAEPHRTRHHSRMRAPSLSPAALEALKSVPRDELLSPDAPERFVDQFVDALDLAALGFVERHRRNSREPYPVNALLKLVLFAALVRIHGQRPLAGACQTHAGLLFLCNFRPPGKSTISRFWRDFHHLLPPLFNVLVGHAAQAGLVGMDLHALDGSKIRAASSMHTAVHRGPQEKKLKQLERQLEKLESQVSAQPVRELRFQQERAEAQRRETLERIELLDTHNTDHVHPKERDARVMRCDPRPLLAYNAQAVVDHDSDLIVAIGLTSAEDDHAQLVPMFEETKRVLGAVAKVTVADTGFAAGEQLHEAHRRHLPVLVPLQAEADKRLLPKSSFAYDPERDVYLCPRGEELPLEGVRKPSKDKPYEVSVYRCHNKACPERSGCTDDRKGRSIKRTEFDEDLERQRALLAKPEMRNLYELRKEIVEHIFGCIKGNDHFRRFTVRGLAKAFAQWALVCIALDLRKLYKNWAIGLFSWAPRAPAYA